MYAKGHFICFYNFSIKKREYLLYTCIELFCCCMHYKYAYTLVMYTYIHTYTVVCYVHCTKCVHVQIYLIIFYVIQELEWNV